MDKMGVRLIGGEYISGCYLRLTGAVVSTAAEGHTDDTAGEGHKQGVMVLIQFQPQNPPVLPTRITPGDRQSTHQEQVHANVCRMEGDNELLH